MTTRLPSVPVRSRLAIAPLVLPVIYLMNNLTRLVLAPLLPTLERDLPMSHDDAGRLFLTLAAGYFIGMLSSPILSRHWGHKRIIAVSCISTGGALFLTRAGTGLTGLHEGMAALGFAAGLYLPSAISTLTGAATPDKWGRIIALHEAAPILAFVSAPLLVEWLGSRMMWRDLLALVGGAAVVIGTVYLWVGPEDAGHAETGWLETARLLAHRPSFWVIVVLLSLGVASNVGVYSVLPLFLVSGRGLEPGVANGWLSLSFLPALLAVILAGWATDRFGVWKSMAVILFAAGADLVLLGLTHGPGVIPFLLLQPFSAVGFFTPSFAALSAVAQVRSRGLAVALAFPPAYLIGAGVVPSVLGALGNQGKFDLGIASLGSLIVAASLVLGLSTWRRPR
ncbi:MAG: MFS transporter [Anaerolineales bacterium]